MVAGAGIAWCGGRCACGEASGCSAFHPLDTYDPVTVLGLGTYPRVMALLAPPTRKVSLGWAPTTVVVAISCS